MGSLFDDCGTALAGSDSRRARPLLLVSVRDRAEITDSIEAGVDIVDLKEPRRGPLAPAGAELWRAAAEIWEQQDNAPALSAALGEQSDALRLAQLLPASFDFAKVGPSGCDSTVKLSWMWEGIRGLLDERIELVAVAYADWRQAGCIDPESILRAAIETGFRRFLIDTFQKDGRTTLDHLGIAGVNRLGEIARDAGVWWTLAGSIRAEQLVSSWQSKSPPDCFGVRGDVCDQGRTGRLSRQRVRAWKEMLGRLEESMPTT